MGAIAGTAGQLVAFHSYVESTLRPTRVALAADLRSAIPSLALARLSPRVPTCPWLQSRSRTPSPAQYWRPF